MTKTDLERRLHGARDCEAAIAALAEYFSAHELVFGHGTDNASDEAFWLLRHLQRWRDDVDWSAPPEPAVLAAAAGLAARRLAERKPPAHLLREALFAGPALGVVQRVLLARP